MQTLASGVASTVGGACVGRVRVGPATARVVRRVMTTKVFMLTILIMSFVFQVEEENLMLE